MPKFNLVGHRSNRLTKIALLAILLLVISVYLPISSTPVKAADVPVIDLELNDGYDAPFAVENIKPGDTGSKSVMLRNVGDLDGQIAIWISNIQEEDYAGDGAHLDDYLDFEVNCAEISTSISMPCSIRYLPDAPMGSDYIWVLNVRAGQTVTINWFWEFRENYQPQNVAQGDTLGFDINYLLGDMPPPNTNMSWLDVNVIGRITKGLLDSNGRTMEQVMASDDTRSISLMIPKDTLCASEDNQVIRSIVISEEKGSIQTSYGQALVSPVYSITAFTSSQEQAGEFKNSLGTLRINYDPALLPSITETIGIYTHIEGSVWAPLWIAADSPSYIGQGVGSLNQSGEVGVIATYDPMESAYFMPSDLNIDPSKQVWWDPIIFASRVGEAVRITVMVTNVGQVSGEENVTLTINGQEVDTERVQLGPLESKEVTFDLTGLDEGEYEVEVSGLSGNVVVGMQINWWLIIVVSSLPIAVLVAYVYSARRWDEMKRRMDVLQNNVTDVEAKLAESEMALAAMTESQRAGTPKPNPNPVLVARMESAPKPAQSVDEALAAYVASAETSDFQKDDRYWVADSFNQVDQAVTPKSVPEPNPMIPADFPAPKSNGKSLEEAFAIEDSIQFEEDVGVHQLRVAKGFILSKIGSEGQLVIDEVPEGQNGLIAMAALSQLVEEGEVRAIQEKRRTVYVMNEP
jgi:hypothetical protein